MTWVAVAIGGGALVAGGASVYSANKASQAAKKNQQSVDAAQKSQQDMLKQLEPYGQNFLTSGQQNMQQVQDYYRKLMSGNRNTTMQTMAPQINAINQQYQGSVNTQRGLFPRGGGTTAQALQLPYQQQGAINNLLFSAPAEGAQGLGTLGSNQASLGLGAFGQGAGLTNSMLNYGLGARQQTTNEGAMLGQGIGGLSNLFMQYFQNRPQQSANITQPYQYPTSTPNSGGTSGWQGFTNPTTDPNNPYGGYT